MIAHHRSLLSIACISLFVLSACGQNDIDMGPECDIDETSIAADDDSDLGISADEVLGTIVTEGETTFDWQQGDDAVLNWEFVDGEDVRFAETVPADSSDDNAGCQGEFLLIGGTFEVETDDGELAESVDVDLEAEATDEVDLYGELLVTELQGDLTVDQNSEDDLLLFDGDIDADGSTGMLLLDSFEQNGDATDHAHELLGQWE